MASASSVATAGCGTPSTVPGSLSSNGLTTWRLSQVFGGDKAPDEEIPEADIVNSLKFDETGEFLAAGDKGGRIVVFQRAEARRAEGGTGTESRKHHKHLPKAEFKFFAEFQSHEAEFDYLKSMEIEEKINQIAFLPRFNAGLMLMTTNDKTIKLWKVYPKSVYQVTATASRTRNAAAATVAIPEIEPLEETMTAVPKRIYSNAHSFHINSISLSSDQQTFISADDLRVNLWSISSSAEGFNVVDIKPENMEELSEVITCASFHPVHCSQFAYSTSKGAIRLCDIRASALCDKASKTFSVEEDPNSKSFFSEIIGSISDMKFSMDGRLILTRDYMTLKLWDVAMERAPVKVVKIHECLRPHLCDLYENDCIFDKFECAITHDGSQLVTGSYSKKFKIFDVGSYDEAPMIASRVQPPRHHRSKPKKGSASSTVVASSEESADEVDYVRKVMHVALHPTQNVLAVTAQNNLFIFS